MRCRVCGSEDQHPVTDATEMMYGIRDRHRYFRCLACGCLQIQHIPESMQRYYGPSYYSMKKPAERGLRRHAVAIRNRYAVLQRGLIGRAIFRLQPTKQFDFLGPARNSLTLQSRILDVGCGSGALVREFRSAGFRAARGVDPFVASDIEMDGAPLVSRATLEEVPGPFDLVMFHHSLEHMPDQLRTLRLTAERLPPGGWCIVRVPLSSSLAWERYGEHWVQLDAPRHFYLHTPASLQSAATKAGLTFHQVRFDSTAFQFWGSEQYARGITLLDPRSYAVNPAASIFSAGDIARFEDEAASLNLVQRGDQAIFYFQKT